MNVFAVCVIFCVLVGIVSAFFIKEITGSVTNLLGALGWGVCAIALFAYNVKKGNFSKKCQSSDKKVS